MVVGQQSSQSGQEALLAFLSRSVLFSGWPVSDLRTIAGWLRPIDVVAGTVICREGDLGNEMYLIESGQVQVAPGHSRYIYDQLGPGAFFGEIALLGDGRRTAMVTMSVTGRIWALPKTSFDQLLSSRPHLREPLMRLASERQRVHERLFAAQAAAWPPSGAGQGVVGANERQAITFPPEKSTLIVGRHDSCDIQIRDPQVSRFHARIDRQGQNGATVIDLGAANGVYVNGVRIQPIVAQPIRSGDELWFGSHPFRFEDMAVVQFVRPARVKLEAYHLNRVVGKGDKKIKILNDISLSIQPGEFVAVVGGSGAGKSTLLNALTGFVPATEGRIFYNGIDFLDNLGASTRRGPLCQRLHGDRLYPFGADFHNVAGYTKTIINDAAGGSGAIGAAYRTIKRGDADLILTSGFEAALAEASLAAMNMYADICKDAPDPTTAQRPFNTERNGMVIAEGGGIVIVEDYSRAKARGARVYAEVVGYGQTSDAVDLHHFATDGVQYARAMMQALDRAGLSPNDVDYVNADGRGVEAADRAGATALGRVFGERIDSVPVSAPRSMTGNPLAGAGPIDLAFIVLAIRDSILPPTINLIEQDPACRLNLVTKLGRSANVDVALLCSRGATGVNAALALRKVQ